MANALQTSKSSGPAVQPLNGVAATRWVPQRLVRVMTAVLMLALLAMSWSGATATPVAADAAGYPCNDIDPSAGLEIRCDVVIDNYLDLATGAKSSTKSTTVCIGPAGTAMTFCTSDTDESTTDVINTVNQCNYSATRGGSTLICSVVVNNHITGDATSTPATINQCNGTGDAVLGCSPAGESTTSADITQCNDSGYGGGTTVNCVVVEGSMVAAALPVTINQCNNSTHGGGDTIACTSEINAFIEPAVVDTTTSTEPTTPDTTTPPTIDDSTPPTSDGGSPITNPDGTPVTAPDGTPVTAPVDGTPVTNPDGTPVTTPDGTPVTSPNDTGTTTPGATGTTAPTGVTIVGDTVATVPDFFQVTLPRTGRTISPTAIPAFAALGLGALALRLARRKPAPQG